MSILITINIYCSLYSLTYASALLFYFKHVTVLFPISQ